MKTRKVWLAFLGILSIPLICCASDTILPGWDLLQVDPALTSFFGDAFEGVPLGTFDFDSTIGVKNVGATDILVHRVASATVAGPGNSATVPTLIDALQLRSVNQVSIMGGPMGFYYMTLQSKRGGPGSSGTMTINFGPEGDPHGTFSSSFDLFVDVRLGSLTGPILGSSEVKVADSGTTPWRHDPTGPFQIPGVNFDLGGGSTANDFWIEGTVDKDLPNGGIVAGNTGVPDQGNTLILLTMAIVGALGVRRFTSEVPSRN